MKCIIYTSVFCFLLSCNNDNSAKDYHWVMTIEEGVEDRKPPGYNDLDKSSTFNTFLYSFEDAEYPCKLKYGTNRISYFDEEIIKELNVDYSLEEIKRDGELFEEKINTWILNTENKNSLTNWLERVLPQKDDDWFSIQPGIKLENKDNYYLTLYTYEQTSGVNGGEWTVWLLKYSKTGELIQTVELGREGFYTFVVAKDTQDSTYLRRHTDNEMLQLIFTSENNVEICQFKWSETEGDIDTLSENYYEIKAESYDIEVILENQKENCWALSDSL